MPDQIDALQLVFRVDDSALDRAGVKAQKVSKDVSGQFKGMAGEVKGQFDLASAAAVAGLGLFLKGAFDAARESAKISAQTAAVIKSTGGAARVSADDVGKYAAQLSKLTGVDDELIQSGENVLLTFTNIRNEAGKGNDVFNQATKATLDLSVALGTDMKSASIQVGKALNDPIKGVSALQRVGVAFTKQQKEQIRTLVESGKTLDAQKIILRELNTEFGGSAEATATSFDKMKVSIGNAQEALGARLVPVVEAGAKAFIALDEATHGASTSTGFALIALGGTAIVVGKVAQAVLTAKKAWDAYKVGKIAHVATDAAVGAAEEALAVKTAASGVAAEGAAGKFKKLGLARLAAVSATVAGGALLLGGDSDQTKFKTDPKTGISKAERGFHDAIVAKGGRDALSSSDEKGLATFDKVAGALKKEAAAARAAAKATTELRGAHGKIIKTYTDSEDAQKGWTKALDAATSHVEGAIPVFEGFELIDSDKLNKARGALGKAKEELVDAKKEARALGAVRAEDGSLVSPSFYGRGGGGDKLAGAMRRVRDATNNVKDAQKDLADASGPTAAKILKNLDQEVDGYRTWSKDVQTLLKRGADPAAVLALSQKGPEYVHTFAVGTDKELAGLKTLWQKRIRAAGDTAKIEALLGGKATAGALAAGLRDRNPAVVAAAKAAAKAVTSNIPKEVRTRLLAEYDAERTGKALSRYYSALKQVKGGKTFLTDPRTGRTEQVRNSEGNLFEQHSAQIARGGAMRVWAEPETGGEAYIPLAPSKRGRSMAILEEVANRFGASLIKMASGGIVGTADPVRGGAGVARGTAPGRTGDAASILGAIVTQIPKVVVPTVAAGGPTGKFGGKPGADHLAPNTHAARIAISNLFGISNIGGYANRNIAGTGVKSDHAYGKALDVMTGNIATHNRIIPWFVANKKYGPKYWISNRRIGAASSGWKARPYHGASPHTDHVHLSYFKDGGIIPAAALPAAKLIAQRLKGRGSIFEDYTWRGAPPAVGRYNDLIARLLHKQLPRGYDFPRDRSVAARELAKLVSRSAKGRKLAKAVAKAVSGGGGGGDFGDDGGGGGDGGGSDGGSSEPSFKYQDDATISKALASMYGGDFNLATSSRSGRGGKYGQLGGGGYASRGSTSATRNYYVSFPTVPATIDRQALMTAIRRLEMSV